ncbi:MAG: ferredoxin [Verrucomicrobiota bacterium]
MSDEPSKPDGESRRPAGSGESRRPGGSVGHPAQHSSANEAPQPSATLPASSATPPGTQFSRHALSRRELLKSGARGMSLLGFGAAAGFLGGRENKGAMRWQIDPNQCIQCGRCATECVLEVSAVKCVHSSGMCGYCKLCTGYFEPEPINLDEGAENQLCPTGAIKREFIEDPYYEYSINKDLCVGCGKCVKGCNMFGNGSLYLQVCHDRCINCNICSIASACPAQAFHQVPVARPYLLRGKGVPGK